MTAQPITPEAKQDLIQRLLRCFERSDGKLSILPISEPDANGLLQVTSHRVSFVVPVEKTEEDTLL